MLFIEQWLLVLTHCSKIRMQLPSIFCVALNSLSVTPLIFCVTDIVSAIKNHQLTCGKKFLACLSNKIVDLDLAPFSEAEMVENHCYTSKKNLKYHNKGCQMRFVKIPGILICQQCQI